MISTAFTFYTPAHRCYCLQQITSKANHRRFHNQCCELKCAWTPGAECSRSPWNPQSCLLFPGSWRCLLLAACCLLPAGRVYVLEWFPRCWAAGREDDLWTCQTIKRICGRWHHRQSTQEQLACFNNLSFTIWPLNLRSTVCPLLNLILLRQSSNFPQIDISHYTTTSTTPVNPDVPLRHDGNFPQQPQIGTHWMPQMQHVCCSSCQKSRNTYVIISQIYCNVS